MRPSDKTTLALRRHIVRCKPSAEDLARRPEMVLTPRDREILVAVHQHRFLITELIELAFFPPAEGPRA